MTPEQISALVQTGGIGLFTALVFYVLRDVRERERRSEAREERSATRATETDKIIAALVSQVGSISTQIGNVTEVLITIAATQREFQIHLQRMALDIFQLRAVIDRRKVETKELREFMSESEK
jgi:hypothetical protein